MIASASAVFSSQPTTAPEAYLKRHTMLVQERQSWLEHWREILDYCAPRRGRWLTSDVNKGSKKHEKIINSAATRAHRVLTSGMMAGITSPARKWFRFTPTSFDLADNAEVRSYLNESEDRIFEAYARSNIYSALTNTYADLGGPGTSALYVEEDPQDIIRGYVWPTGSFCLANNASLRVDVAYREYAMTAAQLVEKFGETNVSSHVRQFIKNGDTEHWVRVLHCIEPNTKRDPRYMDHGNMPFRSCWLELDTWDKEPPKFLRRSGYEEFPVMAVRWDVVGEDVYGTSPMMDALGDAKQLQALERDKGRLVQKIVAPPMKASLAVRNQRPSLLPGDVTYLGDAAGAVFEPALKIEYGAIEAVSREIAIVQQRIESALFADLFLLLTGDDRSNVTAEEIRSRQQEKMLQLGPVLERMNDELLDPLVNRTYAIMNRTGLLPKPPDALQGENLRVEYTSILSQAQKLLGTTAIERVSNFTIGVSQVNRASLDVIDWDRMIRDYAEMHGISPEQVNAKEVVERIRAQQAKQAQAKAQGEAMLAATEGAANLGSASVTPDTALGQMVQTLGPAAAAGIGGAV